MGNQQGRGLQTDQPVQLINQDRPLHVTAATRDNDAKHRLVLTSDKETAQQIWILRPVKTATNMTCRILHETTGEYLYSSTPMDGLRRHVHTWVGNINGDPGAIWVLVPTTSSTNQYTIMNDKSKEYLYTSNKNCQEGTRQAFTWMHNANDDPTMIWEIKPININNNATTLDPFEAAYVLAKARNDPQITSEHLLLVLIRDHPECFPSNVNLEELRQCLSTINPNFDTSTKSATTKSATTESSLTSATKTSTSIPQSPAFVRCVSIFDAITKIIENASESSLNLPCCCIGALLLSENSVARLALERSYVVDCNAQMYLAQRCGISVESVESYVAARAAAIRTGWVAAWEETILVPKSPHMAPLALPSLIQRAQDALGPTVESNWMVPGLILTGQEPRSNQELQAILNVGVDTFVCFTEWGPGKYVSVLNGLISRSSIKTSPYGLQCLHFPIVDFSVADSQNTIDFVEELTKRINNGHTIYAHCYSGRGRTGTIVIPLLMSLYPTQLDRKQAVDYANRCKKIGRLGRTKSGEMPEVKSQVKQIKKNSSAYSRLGHKNKAMMQRNEKEMGGGGGGGGGGVHVAHVQKK